MSKRFATAMAAVFIAVAIALVASMTGCASSNTDEPVKIDNTNNDVEERHIRLSDGRKITCIVFNAYQEGGISCDWNPSSRDTFDPQ